MERKRRSFIGTGWSFPPSFGVEYQGVEMVSDEQDIAQSLEILLSTRMGERIMFPGYGCNLHHMTFESMTTSFTTYIKDLIRTAVLYHEPRIQLETVNLQTDHQYEGKITIYLEYLIRNTNTRSNLVYPFYLEEATDI